MKKWIVTYTQIDAVVDSKTEVEGKNYADAYVSFTMTHPKEDCIQSIVEKEG